jgi:hypothetical protein
MPAVCEGAPWPRVAAAVLKGSGNLNKRITWRIRFPLPLAIDQSKFAKGEHVIWNATFALSPDDQNLTSGV